MVKLPVQGGKKNIKKRQTFSFPLIHGHSRPYVQDQTIEKFGFFYKCKTMAQKMMHLCYTRSDNIAICKGFWTEFLS